MQTSRVCRNARYSHQARWSMSNCDIHYSVMPVSVCIRRRLLLLISFTTPSRPTSTTRVPVPAERGSQGRQVSLHRVGIVGAHYNRLD